MSRQRQRDQHLRDDLPRRRAERLRGLDVAIVHADTARAASKNTNGAVAMKMNIVFCDLVDPEPENRERDQHGDGNVAREQRQRPGDRVEDAIGAGDDARAERQ